MPPTLTLGLLAALLSTLLYPLNRLYPSPSPLRIWLHCAAGVASWLLCASTQPWLWPPLLFSSLLLASGAALRVQRLGGARYQLRGLHPALAVGFWLTAALFLLNR